MTNVRPIEPSHLVEFQQILPEFFRYYLKFFLTFSLNSLETLFKIPIKFPQNLLITSSPGKLRFARKCVMTV